MWQIIGQEKTVAYLRRSLETDSLAHAYLFAGPPHVGKTTLALNLAQALNCEGAERPCGQCPSCQRIATANHADVQIIGLAPAANSAEAKLISTEQIEQMQHSANLPPFEGKCKVFIINEAEFLSAEAANRLLKTLEEPVGRVVFVLLTANDRLLPETVVSRCQRLELTPVPVEQIEAALAGRGIDPETARRLARFAHGCPGWAVLAAADDSLPGQRTEATDELLSMLNADYEARFAAAVRLATLFSQNRRAVHDTLAYWLDFCRDLLLVKSGCDNMITNIDRNAALTDMAQRYSLTGIRAGINCIQMADRQLRQNASPRLALEVLMLDLPRREEVAGQVPPR